jgi:hypothetical protein
LREVENNPRGGKKKFVWNTCKVYAAEVLGMHISTGVASRWWVSIAERACGGSDSLLKSRSGKLPPLPPRFFRTSLSLPPAKKKKADGKGKMHRLRTNGSDDISLGSISQLLQ